MSNTNTAEELENEIPGWDDDEEILEEAIQDNKVVNLTEADLEEEEDPDLDLDPEEPAKVEAVEEAPEPAVAPVKGGKGVGTILMWLGIILATGFALILGWFLFMAPQQQPTRRTAGLGQMQPVQTAPPVKQTLPVQQTLPVKQAPLAMPVVAEAAPAPVQVETAGQEVTPVLISEVSPEDLPESLRQEQALRAAVEDVPQATQDPYAAMVEDLRAEQTVTNEVAAPVQSAVSPEPVAPAAVDSQDARMEQILTRLDALLAAQAGTQAEIVQTPNTSVEDQAKLAALEKENTRLQGQIDTLKKTVSGLKAKEKTLLTKLEDLLGANGWLRKLHTKQAREIKSLQKSVALLQSKPLLPGWKIVGMTEENVIFSDDHRLLRLHVGNSFAGIKVQKIDVVKGIVTTNYGPIAVESQKAAGN